VTNYEAHKDEKINEQEKETIYMDALKYLDLNQDST
jgi:hypothetical protein